jgi:hypothetical protein
MDGEEMPGRLFKGNEEGMVGSMARVMGAVVKRVCSVCRRSQQRRTRSVVFPRY